MNTVFESGDWKVYRQLGSGDRQHVRSSLLNIGMPSNQNILKQLDAAYSIGHKLKMMVRPHLFVESLLAKEPKVYERCVALAHVNLAHQFEPHFLVRNERSKFDSIISSCELVIIPGQVEIDLTELLLMAWLESGQRVLGGNFEEQPIQALRSKYPSFFHDDEIFWTAYANSK
jgi:hypothetical protein